MTFSLILLAISWVSFLIFADKKKIRFYYSTCLLAMYLAATVDSFGDHHYPLWDYPDANRLQSYVYHLLQQIGVYPVVVYLYLQSLPKKQTWLSTMRHIFYWSNLALFIEWIAIKTEFMVYKNWWNIGWSYLADWILFYVFYFHYKWRKRDR